MPIWCICWYNHAPSIKNFHPLWILCVVCKRKITWEQLNSEREREKRQIQRMKTQQQQQQQLTAFDVYLACWMLQKVNLISKNIVVWQTNKAHHNWIKQRTMNFGVNADLAQKNEPNSLNSECANISVSSTRTHQHPYKSARSLYAWNTHTHTHISISTTKHFMMLERRKKNTK